MWSKNKLILSHQEDNWEVFIAKDDNGGGIELIWLFVIIKSTFIGDRFSKNTFDFITPEKEEIYKKTFYKLIDKIRLMKGHIPKRMKPAILKIFSSM